MQSLNIYSKKKKGINWLRMSQSCLVKTVLGWMHLFGGTNTHPVEDDIWHLAKGKPPLSLQTMTRAFSSDSGHSDGGARVYILGISAVSHIFFWVYQETVYKLGQRTQSETKILISALAAFVNPSADFTFCPLLSITQFFPIMKSNSAICRCAILQKMLQACHTECSLTHTLLLAWAFVVWLPTTPGLPGMWYRLYQ